MDEASRFRAHSASDAVHQSAYDMRSALFFLIHFLRRDRVACFCQFVQIFASNPAKIGKRKTEGLLNARLIPDIRFLRSVRRQSLKHFGVSAIVAVIQWADEVVNSMLIHTLWSSTYTPTT